MPPKSSTSNSNPRSTRSTSTTTASNDGGSKTTRSSKSTTAAPKRRRRGQPADSNIVFENGSSQSTLNFNSMLDPSSSTLPSSLPLGTNPVQEHQAQAQASGRAPLDSIEEDPIHQDRPSTDPTENPFLDSAHPGTFAAPPPHGTYTLGSTVDTALRAVARPELQRPRSGPHSPSRGRHSRSRSQSRSHSRPPSPAPSTSGSTSDTSSRETPRPSPTKKRRKHKAASDIWTFWKQVGSSAKYECSFCKLEVARGTLSSACQYEKGSGTGSMRTHLFTHHVGDWVTACNDLKIKITAKSAEEPVAEWRKSQGQNPTSTGPSPFDGLPEFSDDAFLDALTDFIVADDQSINVVKSIFFRCLIILLWKEMKDKIPHRSALRSHIQLRWKELLDQLSQQMQHSVGKISITTDMWTDPNQRPFMAVAAHWLQAETVATAEGPVTSLQLHTDLIAFHHLPGRHTGEHLAGALVHVLDRLKITSRVGWITMDNASNNTTLVEEFAETMAIRGIVFSANDNRIRCFPHITNLACKAVLAALTDISLAAVDDDTVDLENEEVPRDPDRDVIALVRALIRMIRASSLRRDRFTDIQASLHPHEPTLELLRDVDTRWSSTLLMIERFLHLEKAVTRMVSVTPELQKYALHESEWAKLRVYRQILLVPSAFQQMLSHEKIPTLHQVLPSFHRMIAAWRRQKVALPLYANVIDAGIGKLQQYLDEIADVPAYTLALLINPAIKLTWHQKHDEYGVPDAKRVFVDTLRSYRHAAAVSTPAPVHSGNPSGTSWAEDILGSPLVRVDNRSRGLQAEVDAYLADGRVGSGSALRYWQENRNEYPTIYKLAMDILPIPASAVPCERVFSSAKESITARRSRMSPQLMEYLQMLKFSIRNGPSLNFTAGTSREEEIEELEGRARGTTKLPEDITSYLTHLLETCDDDGSSDEDESGIGENDETDL